MTTTAASSLEPSTRTGPRIGYAGWAAAGVVALLFVWFHGEFLWRTALVAVRDKNWSHALIVPLISLYYIYQRRAEISFAPVHRLPRLAWALVSGLGVFLALTGVGLQLVADRVGSTAMTELFQIAAQGLLVLGPTVAIAGIALLHPTMTARLWAPLGERLGLPTEAEDWLRVLGLVVMLGALMAYVWAIFPIRNPMARGYSMILLLFALCWFLLGPRPMKVLWFPIAYLVFAVKISDMVWEQIAWQLQDIAATGATVALKACALLMSFDVANTGNTIELSFMKGGQYVTEPINVAEACSGLRMLMAFIALGTALAFLWDRRWWQRALMIIMTVPIAVGVNILRVTILGLVYLYDPRLASGEPHTFIGMLMLIPAGLLFLGVGWVLDRIIIEEPEQADDQPPAAAPQPATDTFRTLPGAAGLAGAQLAKRLGIGAAVGAALTALVGLAYMFGLSVERPDLNLLSGYLNPLLSAALLALAGALLVGLVVLLPRLCQSGRNARQVISVGVVASVLLVASAGQSSVLAITRTVLFKHPLPLRHQLVQIPPKAGTWEKRGEDRQLKPAEQEALGTKKYLTRIYEDTSWPEDKPGRRARIHVAYYTGKPETVPHVPERCFVAGGVRPIGTQVTALDLEGPAFQQKDRHLVAQSKLHRGQVHIPARRIRATMFKYEQKRRGLMPLPGDRSGPASNVLYFFAANGQFLPTATDVRKLGWDPSDKYAYYCKIEVQFFGLSDRDMARQRAADLLSELLPEIMACLPDWVQVKRGAYPPSAEGDQPQTPTATP